MMMFASSVQENVGVTAHKATLCTSHPTPPFKI